ncbi:MAG: spoIIIJ-associated protein, partial [Acidimicrobiaceae bacterium]
MEWVETTGKTVEEAKEAALDQLGVHEDDAEFEVVEEPRTGLFGRTRGEARVRARVRPTSPRPKAERGNRRRRRPESGRTAGQAGGDRTATDDRAAASSERPDGRKSSGRR